MVSDDLYTKLCEMLLWMVHRRVHDQAAWQTAFQCFVTFVASVGYVDKARYARRRQTSARWPVAAPHLAPAADACALLDCSLNQVDIKVFPAFLKYVPYQSDALRRQIINMIVNRLYERIEGETGNLVTLGLTACQIAVPSLFAWQIRVAGGAAQQAGLGRCVNGMGEGTIARACG